MNNKVDGKTIVNTSIENRIIDSITYKSWARANMKTNIANLLLD